MTKLSACLMSLVLLTACGDDTKSGGGDTSSGTGGGGGEGGGGTVTVNGCSLIGAVDRTAEASVTITEMDFKYTPSCVKVKAGTTVTFQMDLAVHPLFGGTYEEGIGTPDANSPISATAAGMMATFNISPEGAYGFYCDIHAPIEMFGAVHAVP